MNAAGEWERGGSPPPLLFVQYGDYRADYLRLSGGGIETYQAQRRAVTMIAGSATSARPVAIVNVVTDAVADGAVTPHVRVIGLGPDGQRTSWAEWWRLLSRLDAERIVLRTPLLPVLAWAAWRKRPILVVLADSFQGGGPRSRLRRTAMRWALSARAVEYVANHGRASSWQLAALGVPDAKIIPWDIEPAHTPHEQPAKAAPLPGRPLDLLFAGHLTAAKGADDAVAGVAALAARGIAARLTLLGPGDRARIAALADALGIADRIATTGLVANHEVAERMRAADFVIVPSRPDYAEGLPLTIYEAFCARTPLVASDHPMFVGNLEEGCGTAIFPAGDAEAMADRIAEIVADPARYAALSASSLVAWQRLQLPVKFEELVERWLAGDRAWLDAHTLARRDYRAAPPDR